MGRGKGEGRSCGRGHKVVLTGNFHTWGKIWDTQIDHMQR